MMRLAIIGSFVVAVILVLGTFVTGRNASEDTETAVRTVSLLYLDELAGRREQVVATTLSKYISDTEIALGLLEKDDLSSFEKLQAYQARMKQLYGVEKFAFIDNDGLIYTSRGTRNDIALYDIDYKNFTEPTISIKNLEGNNKKVIIAVPLDNLPFQGKNFVVSFMEIDMAKMLNTVSLQATGNNNTFCNIYTADGISLTNVVLGGLAEETNLLQAMTNAAFEKNYSAEKMRTDFANKKAGVVSFTYNGIKETMKYIPIHGTDWMLTYLVRESVISSQIDSISDGIVFRSLIQSIFTALVLAVVFGFMIFQLRRAAKVNLEKSISEAENRVKQQELEEQLALQEELLAQEQQRTQQDKMITALASDYRSVYFIELESDTGICYRKDSEVEELATQGEKFHYRESFTEYAHKFVTEEYREGFLNFIKPENIRAGLEKNSIIAYRYLVSRNGVESFEMLRMAGVQQKKSSEHFIQAVGAGFSDIDSEMRD